MRVLLVPATHSSTHWSGLVERPRALLQRMYAARWYTEVFLLSPTLLSAQDFTVLNARVGRMSS